jgi:hypothetical protein
MPVHARCLYTVGIFADVLTCYTRVKDLLLRTRLRNKNGQAVSRQSNWIS